MSDAGSKFIRRCPKLGGPVTFEYCRACDERNHPCSNVIDCWWEVFDIVSYLKDTVPKEVLDKLFEARPTPKITHLVTLIDEAKKRIDKV